MLKDTGWENADCINLAHDSYKAAGHCERGNETF
jgi:hypothetical protein